MIDILTTENKMLGFCITTDEYAAGNNYYVTAVDSEYSIKVYLYNVSTGKTGMMKMNKKNFQNAPIVADRLIRLEDWKKRQAYTYKAGVRTAIPDKFDYYITTWSYVS